ncbi:MAG TPA: GDSL-type esterase/lipase family protein [Candidatus Angelobacter sp.]|jgi:lysophospholipase L1-like esterase|nr:GDSL-type esterase/lipase family protein [Candidatus Angelobacter sp.]
MRTRLGMFTLVSATLLAVPLSTSVHAAGPAFHTAWATSMSNGGTVSGSNYTCRFVARSTVSGSAVEVRLSNALGGAPLTFSAATVGIRSSGETLTAAPVPLTFGGATSVTIAAGADALSDAATLAVSDGQDVAVSVYVSGANVPLTYHALALETNACTDRGGAAGDHTADVAGTAFTGTGNFDWWLDAVAVNTATATGTVIALGDSITDGACTGVNAHQRWTDVLAQRLGGSLGVANEGISGNRLEGGGAGPDALTRFQRDVAGLPGGSTLFVYEGTNDVAGGASGTTVLNAMTQITSQAHSLGMHVVGATMIPRAGSILWTPVMEAYRQQINLTIRQGTVFDQVVDFDQIVSAGGIAPLMTPAYDCGDHVHPSVAGLAAMGNGVPLGDLR